MDKPQQGELYFVRHQLDWLEELRSSLGFSPEAEVEYQRLVTREEVLLGQRALIHEEGTCRHSSQVRV
jgi:hypothetical protein